MALNLTLQALLVSEILDILVFVLIPTAKHPKKSNNPARAAAYITKLSNRS